MTASEALGLCSDLKLVHVATIEDQDGKETYLESNIVKTERKKEMKYKVYTRDQNTHKVSLKLYRDESKKIFNIIHRYCKITEKAGTDEAFLNITDEVNFRMEHDKDIDYLKNHNTPDYWEGSYFMPFKKNAQDIRIGSFVPEHTLDKKLFIASEIAMNLRNAIYDELGYRASVGISYNKSLAKIASSANKPNHQTVIPIRYIRYAMGQQEINKIRMCGGKISESLGSNQIYKMSDLWDKTTREIMDLAEVDDGKADWIKNLSLGICTEAVAEKPMPNTATGYKTFTKVTTFEELQKFIRLCYMDVI